ncbi:EAL domain-containing response regulator [Stenotrophomonas humi]
MNALVRAVLPIVQTRVIHSTLVVDGNELHRMPLVKALTGAGVSSVKGVADGSSAIDALRGQPWDVVFLDLDVQDITGMQLVDILADRGSKAGVVIMSNQPSRLLHAASGYARARGLNVIGALRKPLDPQVIRDVMDDFALSQGAAASMASEFTSPLDFSAEELRHALLAQEIKPYFQPQHNAATGMLRGAEVLARWHRADGTVLGPAVFLPAFERAGLLESLTNYMLTCAFETMTTDAHGCGRLLAVNVPATVARSTHWAQSVADLAGVAGVDPGRVVIEITEDGGALCNDALSGAVTQLRLRGFQCAIDDFGSGDSSLDRLLCVPFNEIKINRSMLQQAREHPHARSVLASIIAMGKQLVATVVAEGIEDEEDLQLVRNLGCQVTQGYLHGRPMSRAAYLRYLLRSGNR